MAVSLADWLPGHDVSIQPVDLLIVVDDVLQWTNHLEDEVGG